MSRRKYSNHSTLPLTMSPDCFDLKNKRIVNMKKYTNFYLHMELNGMVETWSERSEMA